MEVEDGLAVSDSLQVSVVSESQAVPDDFSPSCEILLSPHRSSSIVFDDARLVFWISSSTLAELTLTDVPFEGFVIDSKSLSGIVKGLIVGVGGRSERRSETAGGSSHYHAPCILATHEATVYRHT